MIYEVGDRVKVTKAQDDHELSLIGRTGVVVSDKDPEGMHSPSGHGWLTVRFINLPPDEYSPSGYPPFTHIIVPSMDVTPYDERNEFFERCLVASRSGVYFMTHASIMNFVSKLVNLSDEEFHQEVLKHHG
jgi:hypothetical protein